jgi:hypothetical protein
MRLDCNIEFSLLLIKLVLQRVDLESQLFLRFPQKRELDICLTSLGLKNFNLGRESAVLID